MNNKKGFTLVELLVVISIVGILGVVALAVVNPAARVSSSRNATATSVVNAIGKAFESCRYDRLVAGRNNDQATFDCCGGVASGACTSSVVAGLGLYKYGYATGFPISPQTTINRQTSPSFGVCVSQQRGDPLYSRYVVGGGVVTTGGACSAGTAP